jgi:hypothetical protein
MFPLCMANLCHGGNGFQLHPNAPHTSECFFQFLKFVFNLLSPLAYRCEGVADVVGLLTRIPDYADDMISEGIDIGTHLLLVVIQYVLHV